MTDHLPIVAAEWLLTYAIHSTVLLLAVVFLTRYTRSERVLEGLWRVGLVGPILTTTIQVLVPGWLSRLVLAESGSAELPSPGAIVVSAGAGGWSDPVSFAVTVAFALWALIALAGLGLLFHGHLRLTRLLRGRVPVSLRGRPEWTGISISRRLTTPVALLTGELCLPMAALDELSDEELNAVVAHEQEHLRRRDPWWLVLASAICRVLFFQPLNWIAARRLRSLAEFLCDSRAVQQTSPIAVASALVSVSRWIGKRPLVASGMASQESLTVRRVRRILEGQAKSKGRGRLVPGAGGLVLFLATVGPAVGFEFSGLSTRYTIAAFDNGGPFDVTIERGRVVRVTLDGIAVRASEIEQRGNTVRITPAAGAPLVLTLTETGGMNWNSRP
jgi:beta-lactamase regulating signal transducer with metallopeptidase domain